MKVTTMPRVRPLSFGHRIGTHYGHMIDRDFLMGRDPFEDVRTVNKSAPPVNIKEEEEYYALEIPLPGYKKNEVSITVENDELVIKGERKKEAERGDTIYLLKEYDIESFMRTFQLGAMTDKDKIKARFKNGILRVKLYHSDAESVSETKKSIAIS